MPRNFNLKKWHEQQLRNPGIIQVELFLRRHSDLTGALLFSTSRCHAVIVPFTYFPSGQSTSVSRTSFWKHQASALFSVCGGGESCPFLVGIPASTAASSGAMFQVPELSPAHAPALWMAPLPSGLFLFSLTCPLCPEASVQNSASPPVLELCLLPK